MKNKFFLLCFLLVNNIFALDYKVTANTQLYTSDSLRLNYYSDINKNEIVSLRDTTISYSSRTGWRYSVKITYDYMPLYTNAEMLVPEKTKDLFDNEILTSFQDSQGKEWVSNNYFKLLKDRDRTLITKLQPFGYERYQKEKTEFDSSYLENFEELSSSYFFNSLIHFYDFFNFCSFYIENIEREDSFYKVKAQVCDWYIEDFKYKYTTGDFVNLKISIDGDYLFIYLDDVILATYVLVDSNTLTELEAFMKTEKCIYSKVTCPRHADGTCDYEDVSSVKTVSTPSTNVTPNKTMTVSENLKLRSAEATTSEVITVMSAGTKVKITGTNTYIDVELDGRTARIAGEMIVGGFVCYKSSMKNWLVPENEPLTEEDKKEIIQKVTEKTAGSHMVITFE